jgi:hypothetical protein
MPFVSRRSTSPPRIERVRRWLKFKSNGNDGPPH